MNTKRLILCTIGGLVSSIFCVAGSQTMFIPPLEFNASLFSFDFANRILLGFTIGISSLKMNYMLHGALIGLIVSFSASLAFMLEDSYRFFMYTGAGIFYGIMIEVAVTKFFKLKTAP